MRRVRTGELLQGGAHLTDALETLERQGMAETPAYNRLRRKAITCAAAAAATQRKNGEFRAALDTLQNIFSRPDVIGAYGGDFGSLSPTERGVQMEQGELVHLISAVCELLATLADVYLGLKASEELDSPQTDIAVAALPALHVAVMAPFSVLDRQKCLELATLNFRTAAYGLRTALLQESRKQTDRQAKAGKPPTGAGDSGLTAVVRAKNLLAILWRKLGDASNELGQLNLNQGQVRTQAMATSTCSWISTDPCI